MNTGLPVCGGPGAGRLRIIEVRGLQVFLTFADRAEIALAFPGLREMDQFLKQLVDSVRRAAPERFMWN